MSRVIDSCRFCLTILSYVFYFLIYLYFLFFLLKWHNQTHRPDQRRHVQTKQLATFEELPLTQCLWTCQIVKLSWKKNIPLKVSFLSKNTSKPYRISLKVSRRPTRQCGDSSQRHLQQQLCCTLIQGPWWAVYPQQTTPSKKTKTTKLGNDEGTCRKKVCNLKACLRFVNRSL